MKFQTLLIISVLIFFYSCKSESKGSVAPLISPEKVVDEVEVIPFEVDKVGDTLDVHNNVYIIYNEYVDNTSGRHLTKDGYNLGLKWQCVEFVKRYYYEHLNHKMPNSYGHAKDFFNTKIADGKLNADRNLLQFTNGSTTKPEPDDLIVFKGHIFNSYGHVAIVSKVEEGE